MKRTGKLDWKLALPSQGENDMIKEKISLGKAGWNMKNEYVTFTIGKKEKYCPDCTR